MIILAQNYKKMAIYIKGTKLKASKFGIKFSGKTEDFIAQIKAITNEKGYFNLEIKERKEVGQYGDTHSLTVDEWSPAQEVKVVKADLGLTRGEDLPF